MMVSRASTILLVLALGVTVVSADIDAPWRAGVATAVITPREPMWMAGYAARTKPSEGKIHDLHAKALALESKHGTRLVVVSVDLIGVPRELRG